VTQNLYAMLGISEKAPMLEVKTAYKRKLGALVHRKHSAERSESAMAELYREERALREAMTILTDPVRRSMYNQFRNASDHNLPTTEQELWTEIEQTVVDQTTLSSLRLLASLTTLPLQEMSLLKAPMPKRNVEEEKTEPLGTRASSLKNRSQRADVRHTIEEVIKPTEPKIDLDATELIRSTNPKASRSPKAPLDTLKERVTKSQKPPQKVSTKRSAPQTQSKNTSSSQTRTPAPKKTKVTIVELVRQHGYSGQLFRAIRENQDITMSGLSQRTNVPVNYIQAIENEDFAVFSSPVFVRGVVKNISRSLGIQDRSIVTGFLNRMGL